LLEKVKGDKMKIVNAIEMKKIESKTSEIYGIDGALMMEHAASSSYAAIKEEFGNLGGKNILVFAGKGNNGGDALALARYLLESGSTVKVCLVFGEPSSDLAKKNLSILKKLDVECVEYHENYDLAKDVKNADIVVDGILGTGSKGQIGKELSKIIDIINHSKYTISIDLPTGMDADTGHVSQSCVKANMTITFGLMKKGMLLHPARSYCGKVKTEKIGIPEKLVESMELKGEVTTFDDAKKLVPARPAFSNKGTFGRVLVISGSSSYTGTPSMVALGALKVGSGLVTVVTPSPFNTVITSILPEAIAIPLPDTDFISLKSIKIINEIAEKSDVMAIGPGLGTKAESEALVKYILEVWKDKFLVIDADGLNLISKDVDRYQFNPKMILTPHPGEFARLTSQNIAEVISDPVKHALEFSKMRNVNVLLKGPTTVVAKPDGEYALNITGNSALAKGGTGDILTGMIAGFMAQGLCAFDAAKLSAYIHGRAAEVYSQNNSEASMLVRDLADLIPQVLREINQ
jgi:NAD(P)H-hydrate epimerase